MNDPINSEIPRIPESSPDFSQIQSDEKRILPNNAILFLLIAFLVLIACGSFVLLLRYEEMRLAKNNAEQIAVG